MTDITMINRPDRGHARRPWVWLAQWQRRHAQAARLDHLSDCMLADIGMQHHEIDRVRSNTLHIAMPFSR